jgi:hypothetical protein
VTQTSQVHAQHIGSCKLGFFVVYAKEVWLWGEMVLVDSSLYFLYAVLSFGNDFFSNFRALRQGDLLSPLLFVFVKEALSRMSFAAVSEG